MGACCHLLRTPSSFLVLPYISDGIKVPFTDYMIIIFGHVLLSPALDSILWASVGLEIVREAMVQTLSNKRFWVQVLGRGGETSVVYVASIDDDHFIFRTISSTTPSCDGSKRRRAI